LRDTSAFRDWNHEFDSLIKNIRRRLSPRDLQPLLKAGTDEERILALLAFTIVDYRDRFLSKMIVKRRELESLANQLEAAVNHTKRVVEDVQCDGRFWLAAQGLLSWDQIPEPGAIEAPTLTRMDDLVRLIKSRGEAFGVLSRKVKMIHRHTALRDLLAYVWLSTQEVAKFDAEIAHLLTASYAAAGHTELFTADRIKKFRQRNLPEVRHKSSKPLSTRHSSSSERQGQGHVEDHLRRPTLGQRIAGMK
jgi:hypothetical protein